MRQIAREFVGITAAMLVICATALLFAQGRILAHALTAGPFSKVVGDSCFIASLPGVTLAVTIWGYSSERTFLSDVLVITVNAILYAIPITLAKLRVIGGRRNDCNNQV